MFKKLYVFLLSALMMLSLFACSTPEVQSASSPVTTSAAQVAVSEETTVVEESEAISTTIPTEVLTVPETEYPLTFTDSYGNETTLESEPQRIISCAPNMTELIFQLGAENRLVGRTDYCDYPDAAFSIDSVGAIDSPNVEMIVSMEPDLVLASSIFAEDSFNQLTEMGINVIVIHEEYDVDGVRNMILSVGEIINCNSQAIDITSAMDTLISETQAIIEGLDKPKVYYAVSFGEYGDYTVGGDTYLHQLIEAAGGENVAEDVVGWSFSLEALVEADPDIIIVSQYMLDAFISTAPYSDLRAVKEGHVYGIDSNLVDRQGFRNAEGILMLAALFHPEAF